MGQIPDIFIRGHQRSADSDVPLREKSRNFMVIAREKWAKRGSLRGTYPYHKLHYREYPPPSQGARPTHNSKIPPLIPQPSGHTVLLVLVFSCHLCRFDVKMLTDIISMQIMWHLANKCERGTWATGDILCHSRTGTSN